MLWRFGKELASKPVTKLYDLERPSLKVLDV